MTRVLALLMLLSGIGHAEITPMVAPSASCPFWRGVSRAVVRSEITAIYYLELELDLVSGVARISDHRTESADERTKKIFGDDQQRHTNALYAICPTAEQLKATCSPGQRCLTLTVIRSSGSTTDRDRGNASQAQQILASIFPDLKL